MIVDFFLFHDEQTTFVVNFILSRNDFSTFVSNSFLRVVPTSIIDDDYVLLVIYS